jgi:hypothetical protein
VIVLAKHREGGLSQRRSAQYRRERSDSQVDGYGPRIRELLRAFSADASDRIAERLGCPYSICTPSGRFPRPDGSVEDSPSFYELRTHASALKVQLQRSVAA